MKTITVTKATWDAEFKQTMEKLELTKLQDRDIRGRKEDWDAIERMQRAFVYEVLTMKQRLEDS